MLTLLGVVLVITITLVMIGTPIFLSERNDALDKMATDDFYQVSLCYRKVKFGYGIYIKKVYCRKVSGYEFVTWVASKEQVNPKIAQLMDVVERKRKMVDVDVIEIETWPERSLNGK